MQCYDRFLPMFSGVHCLTLRFSYLLQEKIANDVIRAHVPISRTFSEKYRWRAKIRSWTNNTSDINTEAEQSWSATCTDHLMYRPCSYVAYFPSPQSINQSTIIQLSIVFPSTTKPQRLFHSSTGLYMQQFLPLPIFNFTFIHLQPISTSPHLIYSKNIVYITFP